MLGANLRMATVILVFGSLVAGGVGLAAHQILAVRPTEGKQESAKAAEAAQAIPVAEKQTRTDRYGDPLPCEAIARLGTTRLRHGGSVGFLRFTPDGKTIVSCGENGVRTWDASAGNLIHLFPKESAGGDVGGASLSPDGKLLATPGEKTLRIWETATAKLLRTIDIDTGRTTRGPFLSTCFSPDGKMLASQNGDRLDQVTLWDPATGRQLRSWTAGEKRITFLAFASDSKTLVTAGDDNSIRSWDVVTGQQKQEIAGLPNPIRTLALSSDGKFLASVGYTLKPSGPGIFLHFPDPFVRICDVATGKEAARIVEPAQEGKAAETRGFESLAFIPGGKAILTCAVDGSLYLCDLVGAKEPRRVWQSSSRLEAVAASPDGKTAAVAAGATIHVIDLASGKDLFTVAGHPEHVYKTAITPDGQTVITASGSDLYLWDIASGQLRCRLQGHHGYINGLEIIDGGRKAVTSAYQDGTLRVWDLTAAREAGRIDSSDQANILQAVSANGRIVAVGGSGSVVVLFDLRTGKEIQRLKKEHDEFNAYGAAFTPDGSTLVVWYSADNMVYLWDLASGKKVREYEFLDQEDPARPKPPALGGRPVYFAAVSPDGRTIAFGSQQRFLELRDLASGELLHRLNHLPDGVCPMVFSPDSKMLAWSGWWNDPSVHVVEVVTGRERYRFIGHTGRVLTLSFSADGAKLISGSGDTTALIWDLTGKLAAPEEWGKPLLAKEIEAAWIDLAGDDAGRAYQAIRRLSAAPRQPVAFLRQHLKPVPPADDERIARLIADLDNDNFKAREAATKELEKYGELAADFLRKALEAKPSLESRRRLERLMQQVSEQRRRPSSELVRILRALEVLERAGTPEAQHVLESLAKGAPEARLTQDAKASLDRLQKHAAKRP